MDIRVFEFSRKSVYVGGIRSVISSCSNGYDSCVEIFLFWDCLQAGCFDEIRVDLFELF